MDIFGFKKRKLVKQLKAQMNQKKLDRHIRNLARLKEWMEVNNKKGVLLIQSYFVNEQMPIPTTPDECAELIKALDVER